MPVTWLGLTYNVEHINGQCVIGPPAQLDPPDFNEELFFSGIPKQYGPDELVPLLSSVGRIYQIRMYLNFDGTSRGFCFVHYCSPDAFAKARTLTRNGLLDRNHCLKIRPSKDISWVKMRRVDNTLSRERIESRIHDVTKLKGFSVTLQRNVRQQDAKIKFASHEDAIKALRILGSYKFIFGADCVIKLCNTHDVS
ncbi:APOBEC1 complementation factor-like [Anopheles cruzii]|uniref:APOBEC1 complementation factor-like n=1 Tax=Anopheles cruzii TaxID=68878 RepID=UPI0022EC281D|nr:APOBEC1 complementation factor-like [Anopheles cruzii]